MRKILPVLLALCAIGAYGVFAQDAATSVSDEKPAPRKQYVRPVVKPTPAPAATPAPDKRGFFERLFGRRRATPAPATPTPRPVQKFRAKPARPEVKKPDAPGTADTAPKPDKPPTLNKTSAPSTPAPAATPAPTRKGRGKTAAPAVGENKTPAPPTSDDPDVQEKYKYDLAKNKAGADPDVQELKRKTEDSATEDEARKAQRAYNRALFSKMRKLEPALKDRIDRVESALMKKLEDQPR